MPQILSWFHTLQFVTSKFWGERGITLASETRPVLFSHLSGEAGPVQLLQGLGLPRVLVTTGAGAHTKDPSKSLRDSSYLASFTTHHAVLSQKAFSKLLKMLSFGKSTLKRPFLIVTFLTNHLEHRICGLGKERH